MPKTKADIDSGIKRSLSDKFEKPQADRLESQISSLVTVIEQFSDTSVYDVIDENFNVQSLSFSMGLTVFWTTARAIWNLGSVREVATVAFDRESRENLLEQPETWTALLSRGDEFIRFIDTNSEFVSKLAARSTGLDPRVREGEVKPGHLSRNVCSDDLVPMMKDLLTSAKADAEVLGPVVGKLLVSFVSSNAKPLKTTELLTQIFEASKHSELATTLGSDANIERISNILLRAYDTQESLRNSLSNFGIDGREKIIEMLPIFKSLVKHGISNPEYRSKILETISVFFDESSAENKDKNVKLLLQNMESLFSYEPLQEALSTPENSAIIARRIIPVLSKIDRVSQYLTPTFLSDALRVGTALISSFLKNPTQISSLSDAIYGADTKVKIEGIRGLGSLVDESSKAGAVELVYKAAEARFATDSKFNEKVSSYGLKQEDLATLRPLATSLINEIVKSEPREAIFSAADRFFEAKTKLDAIFKISIDAPSESSREAAPSFDSRDRSFSDDDDDSLSESRERRDSAISLEIPAVDSAQTLVEVTRASESFDQDIMTEAQKSFIDSAQNLIKSCSPAISILSEHSDGISSTLSSVYGISDTASKNIAAGIAGISNTISEISTTDQLGPLANILGELSFESILPEGIKPETAIKLIAENKGVVDKFLSSPGFDSIVNGAFEAIFIDGKFLPKKINDKFEEFAISKEDLRGIKDELFGITGDVLRSGVVQDAAVFASGEYKIDELSTSLSESLPKFASSLSGIKADSVAPIFQRYTGETLENSTHILESAKSALRAFDDKDRTKNLASAVINIVDKNGEGKLLDRLKLNIEPIAEFVSSEPIRAALTAPELNTALSNVVISVASQNEKICSVIPEAVLKNSTEIVGEVAKTLTRSPEQIKSMSKFLDMRGFHDGFSNILEILKNDDEFSAAIFSDQNKSKLADLVSCGVNKIIAPLGNEKLNNETLDVISKISSGVIVEMVSNSVKDEGNSRVVSELCISIDSLRRAGDPEIRRNMAAQIVNNLSSTLSDKSQENTLQQFCVQVVKNSDSIKKIISPILRDNKFLKGISADDVTAFMENPKLVLKSVNLANEYLSGNKGFGFYMKAAKFLISSSEGRSIMGGLIKGGVFGGRAAEEIEAPPLQVTSPELRPRALSEEIAPEVRAPEVRAPEVRAPEENELQVRQVYVDTGAGAIDRKTADYIRSLQNKDSRPHDSLQPISGLYSKPVNTSRDR